MFDLPGIPRDVRLFLQLQKMSLCQPAKNTATKKRIRTEKQNKKELEGCSNKFIHNNNNSNLI